MRQLPRAPLRTRPPLRLLAESIDYEDLRETLRIHRDVPPIIFANIGTTMKEGHDDVGRIQAILKELAIPAHYIHCDAALCGMTLPFIEGASAFDFRAGIDSENSIKSFAAERRKHILGHDQIK